MWGLICPILLIVSLIMDFVHLHVHSHYSFLDGASRVEDLVARCVELGMPAMGLTDHGNMFGTFEFYKAAVDAGVKPIIGTEAYISPTHRSDRSMGRIETAAYHLLLLAINETGFRNLLKLSSRSYLEGFYYRPRMDRELLSEFKDGLVCCTACLGGEVPSALLKGDEDKALKLAGEYLDIFGKDRFFIEIQNQGYPEQVKTNPALARIASKLGVGLVGTNDVHFLRREDKRTHEILTCISTGKILNDHEKERYSPELFMKSSKEMTEALSEWPESITNTIRIAEMCETKIDFSGKQLPVFDVPDGRSSGDYLRELATKGLNTKFAGGEPPAAYAERLERELQVIEDKGYSSYFLIVNDCVQFAARNNIPAAPRGSGVATLIGYVLGMVNVDPLRYGLLFERFTDPQREEDPDIDLDICQDGRGRVIQYVREKYGHVAQIITYGTLKARAAIRDVGRVLDVPLGEVDTIAKLVPEGPGVTLSSALATSPDLRKRYEEESLVTELIDHSMRLEGLVRHSGVHAAGVVICDRPLENFLPLCKQSDSDEAITQWDGPTCEKVGMMKMDFLGLKTLSVIQRARTLAKEQTGIDHDPEQLPLDDPKVLDLFRKGDTDGVFQFESEGMKGVLMQMKPNRIEDLIAANAMYRPGPMKLIATYCNRKNGKEEVPPIHALVDDILAETYGIMVYQEQVMQVLNRLGKIPLSRALTLIKAISKKKHKVIAADKPDFEAGALENGIESGESRRLFDLILEFAGYGFNKAHSTRYAIIAYQTAFFKVYYPREFIAATLTYESSDRDKVVQYIAEAPRIGVKIAAPDINTCSSDFTVDGEQVRFGLAAVKGVGSKAVEAIVEARKEVGEFTDLFHFCRSVDLHAVNRSTVEALIKCGAFDSTLSADRAAMLAALDMAMSAGQSAAADRRSGQIGLFEEDTSAQTTVDYPDVEPWGRDQLLTAEKETLGFYVTSHPMEKYARVVECLNWPRRFSLAEAGKQADGTPIGCGCMISQVRGLVTKRGQGSGKKMAVLTIEDLSGKYEAVMFPETFEKHGAMATLDTMVYIAGSISHRNERVSIVVDAISSFEAAVQEVTERIVVRMVGNGSDDDVLRKLRELFDRHPGNCRVAVQLKPEGGSGQTVIIESGPKCKVKPSLELVQEMETILGPRNVALQAKKPQRPRPKKRYGSKPGWAGNR